MRGARCAAAVPGARAADRPRSLAAAGKIKRVKLKVERITHSLFHSLMHLGFYKIGIWHHHLSLIFGKQDILVAWNEMKCLQSPYVACFRERVRKVLETI